MAAAVAFLLWLGLEIVLPYSGGAAGLAIEVLLVGLPIVVAALTYGAILLRWKVEEIHVLRRATLGRVLPRFLA